MTGMLLAVSTALTLASLIVNRWVHSRNRFAIHIRPGASAVSHQSVSVCIPARNEAKTIRACVQAVLDQTHSDLELIVVDDRSSDGTTAILESMQRADSSIRIVHGQALPAGWAGKPHALQQGAQVANGTWLCFVDADTSLAPRAVEACLSEAQRSRTDLLSIMTRQVTASR